MFHLKNVFAFHVLAEFFAQEFHSISFQTLKTCAKNSAKTWNANTFFRWNSKSDTLFIFSKKKRARFFIPKLFQTQNLARKIQPKHETQRCFSDFYFFMKHNPLCTCKNCVKIYPDIFSQNMKHKDVFQILTQNMKHNPLYTCKNCIKIYPEQNMIHYSFYSFSKKVTENNLKSAKNVKNRVASHF